MILQYHNNTLCVLRTVPDGTIPTMALLESVPRATSGAISAHTLRRAQLSIGRDKKKGKLSLFFFCWTGCKGQQPHDKDNTISAKTTGCPCTHWWQISLRSHPTVLFSDPCHSNTYSQEIYIDVCRPSVKGYHKMPGITTQAFLFQVTKRYYHLH